MKADDAKMIAEKLIAETDFKKCSTRFVEVKESVRFPKSWIVVFDLLDSDGSVLDASTVIVVDKITTKARFLPAW